MSAEDFRARMNYYDARLNGAPLPQLPDPEQWTGEIDKRLREARDKNHDLVAAEASRLSAQSEKRLAAIKAQQEIDLARIATIEEENEELRDRAEELREKIANTALPTFRNTRDDSVGDTVASRITAVHITFGGK